MYSTTVAAHFTPQPLLDQAVDLVRGAAQLGLLFRLALGRGASRVLAAAVLAVQHLGRVGGVRQLRIKFRAVAFHLFHEKVSRERCLTNEHYYLESIREHRTRCKRGIDQYVRQLSPDNPLFLYPPLAGEALPRYL